MSFIFLSRWNHRISPEASICLNDGQFFMFVFGCLTAVYLHQNSVLHFLEVEFSSVFFFKGHVSFWSVHSLGACLGFPYT